MTVSPFLQAFRDNDLMIVTRTDLDRTNLSFTVVINNANLVTALQLRKSSLGHQQSV